MFICCIQIGGRPARHISRCRKQSASFARAGGHRSSAIALCAIVSGRFSFSRSTTSQPWTV